MQIRPDMTCTRHKLPIVNYDDTLCLFHSLVMQYNLKIAQYNRPMNIKE